MRRGHVSELHQSTNPNVASGAEQVTGAGSRIGEGRNVSRHHEHQDAGLVLDSPPYIPPPVRYCIATRTDGKPCLQVMKTAHVLCFGHRLGRGAVSAEK